MQADIEVVIRSPKTGKVRRVIVDTFTPNYDNALYDAAIALDDAEQVAATKRRALQDEMLALFRNNR